MRRARESERRCRVDSRARAALRLAASWFDEEYRLLCMVPYEGETDAGHQRVGMKAATASAAALLRTWAETGKEPQHMAVKEQWRLEFEKRVREEERF